MTDEKWQQWQQMCTAVESLAFTLAKMLDADIKRSAEINLAFGRLNLVTTKISTDLDRLLVAMRQPVLEVAEPDWCPDCGDHPAGGDCPCRKC